MNRRRFLKYAGAAAAVVGASALGLDYLARPDGLPSSQTNTETIQSTSKTTSSTSTTAKTTDLQIQLFHDYHGDGQQQSDEPTITDLALDIQGIGNDYRTMLQAESDGMYWARNIPVGKQYRITPKTDKYRYVALSNSEFKGINNYSYPVSSNEPSVHLGLMEGFLTLPFRLRTQYFVGISYQEGRYYDRDPDPRTYLWWNGKSGPETAKGYYANHVGTDFGADYGVPVVASAPGTVSWLGEASHREIGVQITHTKDTVTNYPSYGIDTVYLHLSRTLVSDGQRVSRGDVIGLNGSSGTSYPHVHFGFFYRTREGPLFVDPFRPLGGVYSGVHRGYWLIKNQTKTWVGADENDPRNRINYWTKENDPQYPLS